MARVQLPESRLRARRRARRVRLVATAIGFLFLIGAGTTLLAHAPFLRIKNVDVAGVESIATSTIREFVAETLRGSYGYVLPKGNILIYPRESLKAEMLAQFPILRSVALRAQNFSSILVEVEERTPHALWCGKSRMEVSPCFLLDNSGVAYGSAVSFSGSAYVRYYGAAAEAGLAKQYLTEEKFHALDALVLAIAKDIKDDTLAHVEVDVAEDVRMGFKSGFEIIFSLREDDAAVYQHFTLALTAKPFTEHALSEFMYLDLRFGDKLYYKLRGE